MKIPIDDRVKYYLGDKYSKVEEPTDHQTGYDVPIKLTLDNYLQNYSKIHSGTLYPNDVIRLLKLGGTDNELWVQCGDKPYIGPEYPVLVKTRDTFDPESKGVIANLNSARHWGENFKYRNGPVWEDKFDECIWRGVDTGGDVRLDFVKKFHTKFNIGFSGYVQDSRQRPTEYGHELRKPMLTMSNLMKYKYLPVVDGNDKSSSLGWIMASDCVPLMPVPRYHSWLCEPWLKPGVHYVETKRDFSDLEEKLEWCRANGDECKKIARAGMEFMLQFINPYHEDLVERSILESLG